HSFCRFRRGQPVPSTVPRRAAPGPCAFRATCCIRPGGAMLLSRRLGTALWTGAVAAGLAACGGQPVTATSEFTVQQFFSSVHAVVLPGGGSAPLAPVREPGKPQAQLTAVEPVEVQAVLHTGAHPAPGSGPAGTLVLESSIITGLPAKLRYTSTQPFTSLSLAVGGANDYWEITL